MILFYVLCFCLCLIHAIVSEELEPGRLYRSNQRFSSMGSMDLTLQGLISHVLRHVYHRIY